MHRSALILLVAAGLALALIAALAAGRHQGGSPVTLQPLAPDTSAIAVVELFTSEGCSSCPPADRLLHQITEQARATGQRIYPLSFHVDYWNQLGWADPYSDRRFSERQRAYARALMDRVYTPQIVVNGRVGVVGSRRERVYAAIRAGLAQEAPVALALDDVVHTASDVSLAYRAAPLRAGMVVNIAVVERGLAQTVSRGENAGRTLRHANVVRAFHTTPDASGHLTLPLPEGLDPMRCTVIAYAQDVDTMHILGAAGHDFAHGM